MRMLTTDLYEGAYLLSQGCELADIWIDEKHPKKSVIFEFRGEDLEVFRKGYRLGHAKANVLRLKASINEIKDRMFALLREQRSLSSAAPAQTPWAGGLAKEEETRGENHALYRNRTSRNQNA